MTKRSNGSGFGPERFGLTAYQKKWADLVESGVSEVEAYHRAGYAGGEKTRISQLSRNRQNARIQAYREKRLIPEAPGTRHMG